MDSRSSAPAPGARRAPASSSHIELGEVTPWQRVWFVAVALAALALAGTCWLGPETAGRVLPVAAPALHARCLGAMYGAIAMGLLLCARQHDAAVVHIPLHLVLAAAAAVALVAGLAQPLSWPFVLVHAGVACGAGVHAWAGREVPAPAEWPDAALCVLGAGLLAVALALALFPLQAAALWPWPLPLPLAPFYAAALLAFGRAALMVARERRRSARHITLVVLCWLAGLLLALSAWHWPLLRGLPAGVWLATAAGCLWVCGLRLAWPARG